MSVIPVALGIAVGINLCAGLLFLIIGEIHIFFPFGISFDKIKCVYGVEPEKVLDAVRQISHQEVINPGEFYNRN